jgi:hypothetical protein
MEETRNTFRIFGLSTGKTTWKKWSKDGRIISD